MITRDRLLNEMLYERYVHGAHSDLDEVLPVLATNRNAQHLVKRLQAPVHDEHLEKDLVRYAMRTNEATNR